MIASNPNSNSDADAHGLNIGFKELSQYFHLPINQVSQELGICATVLKKICRKCGVPRWPHRKIKSIDRIVQVLESADPATVEEKDELEKEIIKLKTKKFNILNNPATLANSNKYKTYKAIKKGQYPKRLRPKLTPNPSLAALQPLQISNPMAYQSSLANGYQLSSSYYEDSTHSTYNSGEYAINSLINMKDASIPAIVETSVKYETRDIRGTVPISSLVQQHPQQILNSTSMMPKGINTTTNAMGVSHPPQNSSIFSRFVTQPIVATTSQSENWTIPTATAAPPEYMPGKIQLPELRFLSTQQPIPRIAPLEPQLHNANYVRTHTMSPLEPCKH